MNRLRRNLLGTITTLIVLIAGAGAAFAAINNTQVVSGTTDSSVYKAGQSVTISGTINGDVYCAGQTVNVDATVNGDVLCAGQSVTISGTVNGNVRAAGQSVSIGAKITHSLSVAAQQATLESGSSVGSDATFLAQSADVEGSVSRDLHGDVNSLTINSNIGRDVSLGVNTLHLNGSAKIGRNLSYTGPNKLTKAKGANVLGRTFYTYSARMKHASGVFSRSFLLFQLVVVIGLLIMGLVLVALFPQLFRTWDSTASSRAWITLLTGFIASIILPAVILILAITLFGLPLAFLLVSVCIVAYILSLPLSAYFVGKRIIRGRTSAPLVLILGSVILGILFFIPVLGEIIATFAVWYGFGAVLINLKRLYKKPVYEA